MPEIHLYTLQTHTNHIPLFTNTIASRTYRIRMIYIHIRRYIHTPQKNSIFSVRAAEALAFFFSTLNQIYKWASSSYHRNIDVLVNVLANIIDTGDLVAFAGTTLAAPDTEMIAVTNSTTHHIGEWLIWYNLELVGQLRGHFVDTIEWWWPGDILASPVDKRPRTHIWILIGDPLMLTREGQPDELFVEESLPIEQHTSCHPTIVSEMQL